MVVLVVLSLIACFTSVLNTYEIRNESALAAATSTASASLLASDPPGNVDETTAAVITAAVATYLKGRQFEVRAIRRGGKES